MPIAVSLRAENHDAWPLRALWDGASAFEATPSMQALGYAPHLTLGLYADIAASEIRAAAKRLFAKATAVELRFKAVRWFDGPPLVLYAAPEPSSALDGLHGALHRLIAPEHCHPNYRQGRFVPHCTLAMQVIPEQRADAIAFAEHTRISLGATFATGDIVAFPPVRVLAQWRLRAAHAS
ncbi:MAG: 2'-5' RNA ligase family protein [Hyphomicrobiales bacterium]